MTQRSSTFIDSTGLTKWTRWFLYLQIAIAVIALVSETLEYQLLNDFKNGIYASQAQAVAVAEASDARQQLIGIIRVVIFVVSAILILKRIYRARGGPHWLDRGKRLSQVKSSAVNSQERRSRRGRESEGTIPRSFRRTWGLWYCEGTGRLRIWPSSSKCTQTRSRIGRRDCWQNRFQRLIWP